MPDENLQPDIDALKAAKEAITAKLAASEARLTVTLQQLTDLRAEIANVTSLGKS